MSALRGDATEARRYLNAALACLIPRQPRLIITCGLPGSGKTFQRTNLRAEGVPFHILACEAPLSLLRERLLARKMDASEADEHVLERLAVTAEPLTGGERP